MLGFSRFPHSLQDTEKPQTPRPGKDVRKIPSQQVLAIDLIDPLASAVEVLVDKSLTAIENLVHRRAGAHILEQLAKARLPQVDPIDDRIADSEEDEGSDGDEDDGDARDQSGITDKGSTDFAHVDLDDDPKIENGHRFVGRQHFHPPVVQPDDGAGLSRKGSAHGFSPFGVEG